MFAYSTEQQKKKKKSATQGSSALYYIAYVILFPKCIKLFLNNKVIWIGLYHLQEPTWSFTGKVLLVFHTPKSNIPVGQLGRVKLQEPAY